MKFKILFLLSAVTVVATIPLTNIQANQSSNTQKGQFVMSCVALFTVMTKVEGEDYKPFVSQMTKLATHMGLIAKRYFNLAGEEPSYEQLTKARNQEILSILDNYDSNPSFFLERYANCDAFREAWANAEVKDTALNTALSSLEIPTGSQMPSQKKEIIEFLLSASIKNTLR